MTERRQMQIRIDEEQIAEYALCSLRHLYRFHYGVAAESADPIDVQLRATKEALLWMYGRLAERKKEVTLREALAELDRAMSEKCRQVGISINDVAELVANGRLQIKKHFENQKLGSSILGVRVPYERRIIRGNNEIVLTGRIDLVRVVNDNRPNHRVLELVALSTKRYTPPPMERANSIELVAARLGMATYGNFSRKRCSRVRAVWYSIHQDVEFEAGIGEHEMKTALGWIANVALAINQQLYYPQYDRTRCLQCPFRNGCDPDMASARARERPDQGAARLQKLVSPVVLSQDRMNAQAD